MLGKGKYMTIDKSWADGGKPVRYGLVGGQMVLMNEGTRPRPDILLAGKEFFYKNGLPVTRVEDVAYLEQPYRDMAEAFINKGENKPAPTVQTHQEAALPKRGRGRPKKVEVPTGPRKIEIKDEESLRAVAGDDLDLDEAN